MTVLSQGRRRDEREKASLAAKEQLLSISAGGIGGEENVAQSVFLAEIDDVLGLLFLFIFCRLAVFTPPILCVPELGRW